jgi:antitoxin YefM
MVTHSTSGPVDPTKSALYGNPVQLETLTNKMPIQTTYTMARANLAKLCDEVTENKRIVIISRRGRHDVALIAADELSELLETLHLLRSPKECGASVHGSRESKVAAGKSKVHHHSAQGSRAW